MKSKPAIVVLLAVLSCVTIAARSKLIASQGEDCVRYRPEDTVAEDEGPGGWTIIDSSAGTALATLDSKQDADAALAVIRQYHLQCFIGRTNHRPNRRDYIFQYRK